VAIFLKFVHCKNIHITRQASINAQRANYAKLLSEQIVSKPLSNLTLYGGIKASKLEVRISLY